MVLNAWDVRGAVWGGGGGYTWERPITGCVYMGEVWYRVCVGTGCVCTLGRPVKGGPQ